MVTLEINYSYEVHQKVELLLNGIIEDFYSLIPHGPLLGDKELFVGLSKNDVPMAYPGGLPNKYAIGITPIEYYPIQIAYQFAHELCHVFIEPRLTNWLIESFCECMSLIILERISTKLRATNSEWSENYLTYIENIKNDYLKTLDLTTEQLLNVNISNEIKSLKTPYDRTLNFISAWRIFNLFKFDPAVLYLIPVLHNGAYIDILPETGIVEDVQPNLINIENNMPDGLQYIWNKLKSILPITGSGIQQ